MERYNIILNEYKENKEVDNFIREIIEVCKKHGMSISHEDDHGAFEIVKYNDSDAKWFSDAIDATSREIAIYEDEYSKWIREMQNS